MLGCFTQDSPSRPSPFCTQPPTVRMPVDAPDRGDFIVAPLVVAPLAVGPWFTWVERVALPFLYGFFVLTADSPEAPTGGASREAIEHHYDVGREFFRLWLDARMVYSCALWPGDLDEDLDRAQLAKLEWHATAAQVDGASRVLDVGCGWGAMLQYLVTERQVRHVTGLHT